MAHTMTLTIPAGLALCPRCGGHPDLDETGRPYTCYFCCDRGYVSEAVVAAEERAERDFSEQFRPTRLGIVYDENSDFDDEVQERPGQGLFTTMINREQRYLRPYARAAVPMDLCDDDIPF